MTEFHYKTEYKKTKDVLTAAFLYLLLFLPSLVYLFITQTRNKMYKDGKIKTFKSRVYTISIGNLTTGGTGKTPITAEIANYLRKKGERTVILSRGYGGKLPNKEVNVISDAKKIYFSAENAGDEPFWLAKHCKGTSVLTCSSRVKSAKYAQSQLAATRLILDDGFQHQKLERDLNLLVIDSEKQFSNGFVLPLGALREPLKEIRRADKIIVSNKRQDDRHAQTFARFLRKKYKKPTFVCSMIPDKIYHIKTGKLIDYDAAVVAFSAIAQPEQFYQYLRRFDVMATKDFPDHHLYNENDVKMLLKFMKENDSKAIITTEKDAVKLKGLIDENTPVYALKLKPVMDLSAILGE